MLLSGKRGFMRDSLHSMLLTFLLSVADVTNPLFRIDCCFITYNVAFLGSNLPD